MKPVVLNGEFFFLQIISLFHFFFWKWCVRICVLFYRQLCACIFLKWNWYCLLLYTCSKSSTAALIKYKNAYLFDLSKIAFNKWILFTYKEIETKVISIYSGKNKLIQPLIKMRKSCIIVWKKTLIIILLTKFTRGDFIYFH